MRRTRRTVQGGRLCLDDHFFAPRREKTRCPGNHSVSIGPCRRRAGVSTGKPCARGAVVLRYLLGTRISVLLSAPIVYSLSLPFFLLDAWVLLFQAVCFPAFGIPKVRRRDYIAIDRHRLPYLNVIERVNCALCGYANGVLAYTREVAARTEQYWCPIRHARAVRGTHDRYSLFAAHGDASGYFTGLPRLRRALRSRRRQDRTGRRGLVIPFPASGLARDAEHFSTRARLARARRRRQAPSGL